MLLELYVKNDNLLLLLGLRNKRTKAYINSGTVTVKAFNPGTTTQVGADVVMSPQVIDSVPTTTGHFEGTLPYDSPIVANAKAFFDVEVTVVGSDGSHGNLFFERVPVKRYKGRG